MYNRVAYINSPSPLRKDLYGLFRKKEAIRILDIGGCEGEDSIKYSRMFPNAAVYVFEPLPKNQERIRENLRNYQRNNIELIPVALSDEAGTQDFYVSSGFPEYEDKEQDWDFGNKSSSLLAPDQHINTVPWLRFNEVITVPVMRLVDFMRQKNIGEIDFVHMDVQGAELKVLAGAKEKIRNIKAIWLEVANISLYQGQPLRDQIENFMLEQGFHLTRSSMAGDVGDQFYLNKKYFKTISFFKGKIHFYIKRRIK